MLTHNYNGIFISIHAPSRERPRCAGVVFFQVLFQSTLPRGSDDLSSVVMLLSSVFQSTLPRGSDKLRKALTILQLLFQSTLPRGSDLRFFRETPGLVISIHAPSRERRFDNTIRRSCIWYFNPRSLAGATSFQGACRCSTDISIHAPSRERQHQNKLLLYSFKSSIFCELAQLKYSKIYFDVRKLIVSHSSLSCEPKLNFMFHITSHRIILHYFYSCQSICK